MRKSSAAAKISMEMFYHQGTWALGYFVVFLAIYMIGSFVGGFTEDLFSVAYRSTNGFMLVIGIISSFGFLSYYVKNGITRKAFFRGAASAACLLSLALTLAVAVVSLVLEQLNLWISSESPILAFFDGNWTVALASYAIQIFFYYLAGWLIGTGFYRYDWIRGLGFIAAAIALIGVMDVLWTFELASLWGRLSLESVEITLPASFAGSLVLIAAALAAIRLSTRNIAIKL
ncbi:Tat pathway signal protein [Paenibacillaceae bacterium WGS1546]|uniref:Tat pathway signal protein n=1 Tax=Cohnella sp. WGS1546 TaxID=3366810 RepID=UPI00372CF657